MKKVFTLAAIVLLACSSTLVATQSASAATNRGGVSMYNACVNQHGTPSSVALVNNTVNGWRCRYDGGWNHIDMTINVDQECKRVYRGSTARYTDFNNPYSWGCYS